MEANISGSNFTLPKHIPNAASPPPKLANITTNNGGKNIQKSQQQQQARQQQPGLKPILKLIDKRNQPLKNDRRHQNANKEKKTKTIDMNTMKEKTKTIDMNAMTKKTKIIVMSARGENVPVTVRKNYYQKRPRTDRLLPATISKRMSREEKYPNNGGFGRHRHSFGSTEEDEENEIYGEKYPTKDHRS